MKNDSEATSSTQWIEAYFDDAKSLHCATKVNRLRQKHSCSKKSNDSLSSFDGHADVFEGLLVLTLGLFQTKGTIMIENRNSSRVFLHSLNPNCRL